MPGAASEIHNEVKESLPCEDGTRKAHKNLKQQLEPRADKFSVTSSKRKADCVNKSKIYKTSKRNLNVGSFLKKRKSLKKSSLSSQKDDLYIITVNNGEEGSCGSVKYRKPEEKRRRKKRKENMKLDEASRLQRRTRYLLIKMKLEQNLIDAYSGEGWKGQSREKIKPGTELRRATEQILKCKLGIREVLNQLDLLSSAGAIDDSVVAPDGSVHHEHIICAKCKLREAFPDNDIILCDGTCNRAFHQYCLDPPLTTENRDEGWFCKFCKSKMEILEATNAHLGTSFPLDSNWQDIFKEEAVVPDGGDSLLFLEPDWPSDESDDDDYDPDKMESSCSTDLATSESQKSASSSSFSNLESLEDELLFLSVRDSAPECSIGPDSDETADWDVLRGRRQRPTVDYIKLNDELFGKNMPIDEQNSEDEDWGPTRRKRRGKESDAANTLITPSEIETNADRETAEEKFHASSEKIRRPFVRIPPHAVEQLRNVFSENELPSRSLREDLAKQLNLEFEKVNKWFKNSRYLALKERRGGSGKLYQSSSESFEAEGILETAENGPPNSSASKSTSTPNIVRESDDKVDALSLTSPLKVKHRKKATSPADKRATVNCNDDVSLKFSREKAKKGKLKGKNQHVVAVVEAGAEAEADMEKLCRLKDKIQRLNHALVGLPISKSSKANQSHVMFLPMAKLKMKR